MNQIHHLASFLDERDAPSRAGKIRSFEIVLIAVLAVEGFCNAWTRPGTALAGAGSALLVLCAPLYLARRRLGLAAAAAGVVATIAASFPWTGNHRYFEAVLALLALAFDPDDADESVLYLRGVRWLVILVFFFAGVHKAAHGYWLGGHYLAWALSEETFRTVLAPLAGADEVARITSYGRAPDTGPYAVARPAFVLAANLTWLSEIALAFGLAWRRTRGFAWVGGVALIVAIEAAAREIFFGTLYVNGLLLFARGNANRYLVPVAILAMLALAASRIGLLPPAVFY